MSAASSLPVLMYHYISRHPDSIAVSPDLFASHCETLAKVGWRGIGLDDAERYFLAGEPVPAKSCLITFDDGYLDNYVYAWPILEKYGHKGVVFAVSGRMEQGDALRPTVADVWNGVTPESDLPRVDAPFVRHPNGYEVRRDPFFTWSEARKMEASGVVGVASHTLGHQGVFINDDYAGFFLPGREGRTFHSPAPFIWGMPRFVMGPGLLERAFVVNPELVEKIITLVPQDENEAFVFAESEDNMQELHKLVASYEGALGRMETDEEMDARMREELVRGKNVLEDGLGHTVTSLCWPWGAYTERAREVAQEAGFSVFFTTRAGANPPKKPLAVKRFKAKANAASWLKTRVRVYANPLFASLYASIQLRTPGKSKKRKAFVNRQVL